MGKTFTRADVSEIGGKLEAVVKMFKFEMMFRQRQGDFVEAVGMQERDPGCRCDQLEDAV